MLRASLESVVHQRLDQNVHARLIVVDNDNEGSAAEVIRNFAVDCPWPVTYDIEPVQNIALARNRCVRSSQADYLAFIDDDEVATDGWLQQLLNCARGSGAAAVFGPVLPMLPAEAPTWIVRGRFFESPRRATGSDVPEPASGNCLIARSWIRRFEGPFDSDFGLTGGEDTEFFGRLEASGGRLVWCDEAVVYEHVPPDRLTVGYLMRRAIRNGQNYARMTMRDRGVPAYIGWFLQRLVLLLAATAATAAGLLFGRHIAVRALQKVCTNLGQLSVLLGWTYEHYRHVE